jgi:uncharacterized membrane protein YdjX (TVP38/TMEM64 family)
MWTKFVNWVNKIFLNPWYIASAVTAFASVIFFFQIGSYGADKNNTNGLFTILGIVFGVGAIALFGKAWKTSGGNTGYKQ